MGAKKGRADASRRSGLPSPPPVREFRQERARLTYERLLRSAAQLFVERGIRATQAADIAQHAGVSVGAFYRYFDDKQSVLVELIHQALEHNRVAQAEALRSWRQKLENREVDGRSFLERAVEGAAKQQGVPPELLREFVALSHQDGEVSELRRAYDESDRRELARCIAAVTSRDRIPSPLAAARVVDIAIEEVVRWSAIEGGRTAREARAALVDMLERYLFGGES